MKRRLTAPFFFVLLTILQPLNSMGYQKKNTTTEKLRTETVTVPDGKIKELESGLSAVKYTGDDGFDSFLDQGGAASDQDVLLFLKKQLSDADVLRFAGASFGCSTISVKSHEGGYFFGRNFDWHRCNALVVTAYPENAYASVSTVNTDFIRSAAGSALPERFITMAALYAPLDGMNEKGLCVAVNMIEDSETISQDTGKKDITTTTAVRLLLDKAADTDEAVKLLASYDLHASFGLMVHFAISDAEGNSVAVEYVHNTMNVIQTPVLTNFYLSDGDKKGIGSSQSHTRYRILEKQLERTPLMDAEDVSDALESVGKKNFKSFETTEWSIVFDQSKGEAWYYHRENFNHRYQFCIE